jgi:superfamily I DNA and/or RNA helicase
VIPTEVVPVVTGKASNKRSTSKKSAVKEEVKIAVE